ncbi:hypothetical protein [Methylobacter svalbardensis]|uniref:hypothetical protein n=1 Tax=Methylobacter svalbardensis TaxID=3080016 RepID=UPI0030EBE7FD
MIKKLSTMEINIEEIISSVRHCYAEEDNDKKLAELLSTQAVTHAFNAYFDLYFPKFPLNGEKPEVLSCQSEDGGIVDPIVQTNNALI